MDRARRLQAIDISCEYEEGGETFYGFAFSKVEENVLGTVLDKCLKDLQV